MLLQISTFLINALLINAVFLLSFLVRYGSDIPKEQFEPFKEIFPALTLCYMLSFVVCRMFPERFKTYWQVFSKVFAGMLLGTIGAIVFLYVFRVRWLSFPSSIFVVSFLIGTIFLTVTNAVVYRIFSRIRTNTILVGQNNLDEKEKTLRSPRTTYIKVGSIFDILKHKDIDEIMLCDHIHEDSQLNLLVYLLLKLKVRVYFEPGVYAELLTGNLENDNSLKYLATFLGKKSEAEELLINILDYAASIALTLLLLPFMVAAYVLVKLSSRGPGIYTQKRVGKDGIEFTIYKFRTMVYNAEKISGFAPACENDPRITPVGNFLRKTRLDELPQLFNVLRGQISLVGPRPENVYRVNSHRALRGLRLAVKPGLTGLAQIRGSYDLQPRHKIKYDYLYIQQRSFLLNIYILLKTIPVVLGSKGR